MNRLKENTPTDVLSNFNIGNTYLIVLTVLGSEGEDVSTIHNGR